MLTFLAAFLGTLCALAAWACGTHVWTRLTATPPATVTASDVLDAVRAAGRDAGLSIEALADGTFDLAATGKLHEVIQHTATALKQAHPIRTVEDVASLFERARR